MIALVKRKLQINRLVIQGHIRIVEPPRQPGNADLALAEISSDGIDCLVAVHETGFYFIQIRVIQVPQLLILQLDFKLMHFRFFILGRISNCRLFTISEFKLDPVVFLHYLVQRHFYFYF